MHYRQPPLYFIEGDPYLHKMALSCLVFPIPCRVEQIVGITQEDQPPNYISSGARVKIYGKDEILD